MAIPRTLLAAISAAALSACGPGPTQTTAAARASEEASAERAYLAPPTLQASNRLPGGRIGLVGHAQPGARVRLATPAGEALMAAVDASGVWRAVLPPAADLRLLGLSMVQQGRAVQAEGYLAVTPDGRAAQLRSGAGAIVLGVPPKVLRVVAIDFDKQGGAVISGVATPGSPVRLAIDRTARQANADADGRFVLALNEPLAPGAHVIEAADGAARVRAEATISPAPPLTAGPFRAATTPLGWRIDWRTPGGGVQTTLLIGTSEPAT